MTRRELLNMPLKERLALAQDPATPPRQLGLLFNDWHFRIPSGVLLYGTSHDLSRGEQEVADALAAHPNTPPDALTYLAIERPAAFGRNPIASLLPLERPDFILDLRRDDPGRLLRQPEVPLQLVQIIATHSENPDYRREAELHIILAGEAGPDWQNALRTALIIESRTSLQMQDPRAMPILRALVVAGCAPAYLLPDDEQSLARRVETLAGEAEAAIKIAVAVHVDGQWNPDLCRCLALSWPSISDFELKHHAKSLKWLERLGIALNTNTVLLDEIMPQLAEDGNRLVRAVARARLRGETVAL